MSVPASPARSIRLQRNPPVYGGRAPSPTKPGGRHLGIDPETGAGAWPSGLLSHAAGVADDGTFIVSEVWSSRQDQAAWEQKLAPALASIGVTVVPRVRWVPLIAHHQA